MDPGLDLVVLMDSMMNLQVFGGCDVNARDGIDDLGELTVY